MDPKDLKQIGKLMEREFETNNKMLIKLMDVKFDQFGRKFEDKLLVWKSEIVNSVDALAKEVRDESEFRDIGGHQITSNTRRIENLEKKAYGAVQSEV